MGKKKSSTIVDIHRPILKMSYSKLHWRQNDQNCHCKLFLCINKATDPPNIPRGEHFHWLRFFKTKIWSCDFLPKILVLHRWPGSLQVCMRSLYAFERIVALLLALLFSSTLSFAILFLNGGLFWAFAKLIEKLVALFFYLLKWLYFGAYLICAVQNFGAIHLLHALIFVIACVIP